jgi:nicotinate phosphoribosyltransferase
MRKLLIASEDEVLRGEITDIYFDRTVEILKKKGLEELKVRMEVHLYGLPRGYNWAVFAGVEEVIKMLEGVNINLYSLPEGTLFTEVEPLMLIEGKYINFAKYETAILGILRHASSIASKAARIKKLAGEKQVLFFGLRAIHPVIAPMVDRAAFIGGCDAVSGSFNEKYFSITPRGTMPHALMIAFGDNIEAWKAYDEVMPKEVPRIILADTFEDERTEALKAVKLLGDKLDGIRLDTPSSRRGNFKKIINEVRWTLSLNGYRNVKIIASGGIDESNILELKEVVDAFGVGTSIAFPPSIDLSMDIVEKEVGGKWVAITKRGKWPGAKQIFRCKPLEDEIVPWGERPTKLSCEDPKPLLVKYLENGRLVRPLPLPNEIRQYVLDQLSEVEIEPIN